MNAETQQCNILTLYCHENTTCLVNKIRICKRIMQRKAVSIRIIVVPWQQKSSLEPQDLEKRIADLFSSPSRNKASHRLFNFIARNFVNFLVDIFEVVFSVCKVEFLGKRNAYLFSSPSRNKAFHSLFDFIVCNYVYFLADIFAFVVMVCAVEILPLPVILCLQSCSASVSALSSSNLSDETLYSLSVSWTVFLIFRWAVGGWSSKSSSQNSDISRSLFFQILVKRKRVAI